VAAGASVARELHAALDPDERGELCTSYVRLKGGTADDLRAALEKEYRDEPFVHVARRRAARRPQKRARLELRADRAYSTTASRAARS